jgi:transketolase
LIAIVDRNDYCLDGRVDDIMTIEPLRERWESFGWEVHEVDGHSVPDLIEVLTQLKGDNSRQKPAVVIAKTVKGKGVGFMEQDFGWHVGWLNEADEKDVMAELEANR